MYSLADQVEREAQAYLGRTDQTGAAVYTALMEWVEDLRTTHAETVADHLARRELLEQWKRSPSPRPTFTRG